MRDADAPRSYAPTVDWALARRVTRLGSRDLNGSKEVVELVGTTPTAIGYSGMGYGVLNVR